MPTNFVSRRYSTAKEFIDTCGHILVKTRPTSANLPLASSFSVAQGQTPAREDVEEWWISLTPETQPDGSEILFAFIAMGTWPGGLACSVDPKELGAEYIKDAMQALVDAVRAAGVSSTRLTSVTAPTSIGYPFADAWAAAHGLTRLQKPIVHMTHAVATRNSLRPPVRPKIDGVDLAKVVDEELNVAAQLIVDFTRDFPHKSDLEGARKYVKKFIQAGEIYRAAVEGTLKAFVVITRRTPGVKAVAHVYTVPDTRGKGLAEALLRYAIESTLSDPGVDQLCLFVDPSNAVAARVYGRVGFVGLETGVPDDRTEEWAEVGFEGVKPLEF